MTVGDRVVVVGPPGGAVKNKQNRIVGHRPDSAQLNRVGTVVSVVGKAVAVKLDGEDRPRNFKLEHLKGV